jgi:hypothetical protein
METEDFHEAYRVGKTSYIGRGRYPNLNELKIESNNFELINSLSSYEHTVYTLINRFKHRYKFGGKFSRLRSIYLAFLELAENTLNTNQIDFIVFDDTPHQPLEYLIFLLAKVKNIGVIVRRELPSLHKFRPNLAYCTLDFPLLDKRFFQHYNSSINNVSINALGPEVKSLFDEFQFYSENKGKNLIVSNAHYGKRFILKELKWYFSYRIKFIKKPHLIFFKSIIFFLKRILINKLHNVILTRYYDKLSIEPDLTLKYFYFPLNFQPEATTNPLGGIFENQFMAIKLIQSMLPEDTILYVREHPRYWKSDQLEGMHLVRSKSSYKEISLLGNVKLLDVQTNPYELIYNSIGVITVTGTSSFEAFGFNKPAIVLGNYFYNQLENAYHPRTMHDLKIALHKISNSKVDYHNSFISTLQSLEKISISLTSNDPKVNKEAVIKMLADVILES